jgi:hypothetical protein
MSLSQQQKKNWLSVPTVFPLSNGVLVLLASLATEKGPLIKALPRSFLMYGAFLLSLLLGALACEARMEKRRGHRPPPAVGPPYHPPPPKTTAANPAVPTTNVPTQPTNAGTGVPSQPTNTGAGSPGGSLHAITGMTFQLPTAISTDSS